MPRPAEFLRLQLRARMAVFTATAAAAAVLAMMGVWWWPAILLAAGLLIVLQRLAGKGRALDPERLRRGILGEEAVANALAELPPSYLVLHSLSTGHGDVDHLVIGPTGVFAIETKAWEGTFYRRRGQLYSNGKPADHVLRQARGAAGQVRNILLAAGIHEWVEAVVVASQASVSRSPVRFQNVYVLSIKDVVDFITSQSRSLGSAAVLQAATTLMPPGEADRLAEGGDDPPTP